MTCIYIIDDDPAMRHSLAALISTWPDCRAEVWASGSAFLESAHILEPGVLLLDQDMPGVSGLDVLRAIADDQRFAVVLMTGAADIRLVVETFRAGAVQLIEKPCDPELLHDALAEAGNRVETARPMVAARARIDLLSPRERDVVRGMIAGSPNKVIAHALGISPRTVEVYRSNLMAKLGVVSLSAALRLAFIAGLAPEAPFEAIAQAA